MLFTSSWTSISPARSWPSLFFAFRCSLSFPLPALLVLIPHLCFLHSPLPLLVCGLLPSFLAFMASLVTSPFHKLMVRFLDWIHSMMHTVCSFVLRTNSLVFIKSLAVVCLLTFLGQCSCFSLTVFFVMTHTDLISPQERGPSKGHRWAPFRICVLKECSLCSTSVPAISW